MFSAGTSRRRPFRISATLQPSSLGNQLQCGIAPLHVKGGGKSVKEVAVENPLSNPLSRGGHTLMDTRTDVNAVPHAGLGFHVLRVQVMRFLA